ncbi:predicted protein [Plenodomus lingam JN3]|uniref:Predicted protein n=1 Tax=Leptosphaeria maculans (strain JN3 / isolate v23.1.3 / race Av1-4-5-6-7-8) TaxID=985895 RepID=E5R5A4_LEPMJ|nr:predicted protein [Plenodomus lingam JN3]CBX92074.1 predicted protein [Plenodomus lingam JN3]
MTKDTLRRAISDAKRKVASASLYRWLSLKIIKSGGHKLSTLDIKHELLDLLYVTEAMVGGGILGSVSQL